MSTRSSTACCSSPARTRTARGCCRTGPNPQTAKLKTWATIDPVGTRRVVVINKDTRQTDTVVLRVPGGADRARVERLAGPSVTSTRNVTLGGLGYGDATFDGKLRGKPLIERLGRRFGAFRLSMPPGTAALVTIAAAQ